MPPLRIAIVGPESCGKTTLTRDLAAVWDAPWVEEISRGWLEARGGRYTAEDLPVIARLQREAEDAAAAATTSRHLFCDTNALVVRVWSQVKYGQVHPDVTAAEGLDRYALHLLTAPDLPWEADPLRESPHDRDRLFDRYQAALRAAGVPFVVVRGVGADRLAVAHAAVASVG